MTKDKAYWLAWLQINGLGAILLQRIHKHFGNMALAWTAPGHEFAAIEGFGTKLIAKIEQERSRLDPDKILREYSRQNSHFWTPTESEYPRLLLEIPSPPPILHYRGQVNLDENLGVKKTIAIVGTRYPSEYGKRWTRKISKVLAEHDFTIVSGMAAGIDTEAHLACLAAGGRTIAVLGTGVDIIYPASNRQLYQQIQERGLVLSEYPGSKPPNSANFPPRNRIIAGLCRAAIVMEAPIKSGALITSRFANEFGRDVYVLPGALDNQKCLGSLELLNRGAHLILSEAHLLEMLGTIPQLDTPKSTSSPLPELEPKLAQIYQTITTVPISLDAIVQQTKLETVFVLASLSQLELMGLITQLPGMQYKIN